MLPPVSFFFNLHDSLSPAWFLVVMFIRYLVVASLVYLFYEYWAKRSDVFGMG